MMAEIAGMTIPVTIDSGAAISLVPLEVIRDYEYTGETSKFKTVLNKDKVNEGKVANVRVVGKDRFQTRAVAVPGEELSWMAALRVKMTDESNTAKLINHIAKMEELLEADTHYLPPRMEDGKVLSAVRVSKGEVVVVVK